MLARYAARGLRLVEVDKADLTDLPDIAEHLEGQPYRFIVFCDDLTFDAGEAGYKALKVMLDGSIAGAATNVLIYATSNRRHLMPEYFSENLETRHVGEEVHPGETVEEKISLSERFGLWISFYPFAQDDYLAAVDRWLAHFGVAKAASGREADERTREALQFALQRGSRSGRVAWQFARHWAGGLGLKRKP
jgi:predicted AAA+ superfamily ATPase